MSTGEKTHFGRLTEHRLHHRMDGKDPPVPPTIPLHAWGSRKNQIREETSVSERQRVGLLKVTSSGSWPRHADSPTSASDTTFSSVASESEVREALHFMHKFLQSDHQESPDKVHFLDCIDTISSAIIEKGERFMDEIYNPSLIRDSLQVTRALAVCQFLLPSASSRSAHEREVTLAGMTRLIGCIPSNAIGKGMKDLKLGQLAGCFTLCCGDSCEAVCLWAADGLHHLYTLIMQVKCRTLTVDSPKYQDLLKEWGEEKLFWLAWFCDATNATMVFKRRLRAEEQTDFILTAIKGMRNDNVHDTKCAIRMLKAMLKSPVPDLVRALKSVQLTYKYLEHISDNVGRRQVFRYLCLLGSAYPEEVVKSLLGCSLECNTTSAAMWRALTTTSDPAMKILTILQCILLEQPLSPGGLATKASLNPLAAISALYEILRHPTVACKEVLKEIYPTLSIALLCQISYTMHFMPKEIEIYWRTCMQQKTPTPVVPFRSALRTFKVLLRCASHGDQVLIMNKRRGSELLINPSTHQKGLYLFARAMIRNEDCASILPYLLKTLDNPEDFRHITVMTFLVELLRHQTFNSITEYQIIRQLWKQLNATKVELRTLALDGMLQLAAYPEKMAKLEPALPDILARLKESNRAVNVKALKVLRYLLKSLESQEVSPITVEVANRVIPLFDDASHKVRLAAICAFSCLFDIIKREEKGSMRVLAMQSLVPLMVHLFDGSPAVIQASREALKKVDIFLKSFIKVPIREEDSWDYCNRLLKRYRRKGETILVEQAFSYLETSQYSLREVALKLLEIIAMGSKSKETLSAIATVLNLVKRDPEPNNTDLIPQIMEAMARESSSESLQGDCWGRLHKFWRR